MTAKPAVQTTLTCDVEDCPHHLTLAGDIITARQRAADLGWTSNSKSDWCGNHPDEQATASLTADNETGPAAARTAGKDPSNKAEGEKQ